MRDTIYRKVRERSRGQLSCWTKGMGVYATSIVQYRMQCTHIVSYRSISKCLPEC